ncbi:MAG: hypothetical protein JW795_21590 [Chitinivibrionales bacterium]|nr:hypothetical protein [Chitinivibrionales bacterium]
MLAFAFPALAMNCASIAAVQAPPANHEASCFFHEEKLAIHHCDRCGRFICELCEIEIENQHLCPTCTAAGRKKGTIDELQSSAFLYDQLAYFLIVFPLFFLVTIYVTFITAPMGLYVIFRYKNRQKTPIPRRKIRFTIVLIIGILEIVGWIAAVGLIIYSIQSRGASYSQ